MGTWWSVHVEAVGDSDDDPLTAADDRVVAFAQLLSSHSASISAGAGRWSATVSVEADTAPAACNHAATLVAEAARQAGLPLWPVARLEAVTEEELDLELARPNFPELVGVAEVAELLEVSKQRVSELARDHSSFPRPVITLAATPVWHKAAIQTFLERWDRRPGPKPDQPLADRPRLDHVPEK